MIPLLGSAIEQTWLVVAALAIGSIIFVRERREPGIFPHSVTQELKGLAILTIIFGHVGYFLIQNHNFLVPLSNFSGLGVDLFLIMSGFGMTMSALARPVPWLQFYRRRFGAVYLPVIGVVLLCIVLDAFLLQRSYPLSLTIKNLLGFFPQADLYKDVNSPLWFITPLLFYYLLFPLFNRRRARVVLPVLFLALGWVTAQSWFLERLPVTAGVQWLYRLHTYGFAIGTLLGTVVFYGQKYITPAIGWLQKKMPRGIGLVRIGLFVVTLGLLSYTLVHTHIGEGWDKEEFTSLVSSLLLIATLLLNPVAVGLWRWFGKYSFGIYLLHWPLMYRYDIFFWWLPSGVAMILYLGLFVGGGYGYHRVRHLTKQHFSGIK